jgi:hypothetical protein
VTPVPWEEAGAAPHNNVVGEDPQLTDPENGDFRPLPGSPATAYGCRIFPSDRFGDSRGRPTPDAISAVSSDVFNADAPATITETIWGARGVAGATARAGRTIEVSGPIDEDTTWDVDTVRVVGDVLIEDGVTLSIDQGVQVAFDGHHGLFVQGTLLAIGTADNPIQMTSSDPAAFAIDSTTAGSWFGIRFNNTCTSNERSRIEYCLIEYCKAAGDSSRGGALSLTGFSKLRVANCVFRSNAADYGAVAYCANFASPEIVGCLMIDNHAFIGGSTIFCLDAYPALANNTIVFNPVHNEAICYATGAIHNHISKARVVNCIIRDNASQYFLGGQIREGKFYSTIYNDIQDGHPGEGNFDEDPQFEDSGSHPFALSESSPCINAGTPETAGLWLPPLDLAGSPRIRMGRIDVGAYEWAPPGDAPEGDRAVRVRVLRNAPNPFAAGTAISFAMDGRQWVRLLVLDSSGRKVATLLDGAVGPGVQSVWWDGHDDVGRPLASGVYFCRLCAAGTAAPAMRILLLR